MTGPTWLRSCALAALALSLAACGRGADSGATANPVAPGSPGTGNDRVVVQPAAPDGPTGGPPGVKGSVAHPGSSGSDVAAGVTGKGTDGASGGGAVAQPGTGLGGGLGEASPTAAMGGSPAGDGSPNTTPKNRVGSR